MVGYTSMAKWKALTGSAVKGLIDSCDKRSKKNKQPVDCDAQLAADMHIHTHFSSAGDVWPVK